MWNSDYIGHMSLREALDILKKYYEKQYESCLNVSVEFKSIRETGTSHEFFSNDVEYYTYYDLCAEIKFSKKIGSIVIGYCSIKKYSSDFKNDLLEIFKESYVEGEDEVVSLTFPTFKTDKIDYGREVAIFFRKKENEMKLTKNQ